MSDEPRYPNSNPPTPFSPSSSTDPAARQNRPPRRDPRDQARDVLDNSPESEIPELHPSADTSQNDAASLEMPNPNEPDVRSSVTPIPPEAEANSGPATPTVGHPNDLEHGEEQALSQHRDPLTGAPGAHPVGVGIGAVAGGAAAGFATGAVVASVAGPIGTAVGGAVGAAIGAIAGGLAGKGIAESINPTAENAYWRDNYLSRPYVDEDASYDEYQAAYQYGWEARARHPEQAWEAAEGDLRRRWEQSGHSTLTWEKAKHAIRDAWERVSKPDEPPINPR